MRLSLLGYLYRAVTLDFAEWLSMVCHVRLTKIGYAGQFPPGSEHGVAGAVITHSDPSGEK
jgi:hypothetical protein